jgi:hypothetical protein
MLADAGLTLYRNDIGRTRALMRFIALGMIYRDFCQFGRDESCDADTLIGEAVYGLGLSRVRIGQVIGPEWEKDALQATDDEIADLAVLEFTDTERRVIAPVLVKGFGSESALADALCKTTRTPLERDEDEEPEEEGLDGEDFPVAARIYDWVDQGMQRL